jgi:hypothetical protein
MKTQIDKLKELALSSTNDILSMKYIDMLADYKGNDALDALFEISSYEKRPISLYAQLAIIKLI